MTGPVNGSGGNGNNGSGKRRECRLDECGSAALPRAPWCDFHTHDWVAAAEVPLDPRFVAGAARTNHTEIREHTFIRVLEVICSQCRQAFAAARDTACDPAAAHLRGGPPDGRRQRREDEDEGAAGDEAGALAVQSGA